MNNYLIMNNIGGNENKMIKIKDLMTKDELSTYQYGINLNNLYLSKKKMLKDIDIDYVEVNKKKDKVIMRYYENIIEKSSSIAESVLDKK